MEKSADLRDAMQLYYDEPIWSHLTEKELSNFVAELIISNKGGFKTELIYDEENFPNYDQFRIFDK